MIKLISDIDEVGEEDVIAQEPAFQPPREVLTPLYQLSAPFLRQTLQQPEMERPA